MDKPQQKTKTYYDYNECADYVAQKYNLEKEKDYFWGRLVDGCGISNGSSFAIYLGDYESDYAEEPELMEYYMEFVKALCKEFGDEIEFEVWW